jgi:hypothetical protein
MVQAEQQQQSVYRIPGRSEVHTSTPREQITSKVCYKGLLEYRCTCQKTRNIANLLSIT